MVKKAEVVSLPEKADHHDHSYHQLVFGLQGATEFDVAGAAQPVSLGQGCVLPCSTDHAFWGMGDNQIVVINLPIQAEDPSLQKRIDLLFKQSKFINCSSELQILISALSREMQQSPNDPFLQSACSHTIVCALQRHLEQQHPYPARFYGRINMSLIDSYIDLHIDRKILVSELAGLVFLSCSQFFDRFREQTGKTPQQYVLNRRFDAALKALTETREPLAQIASRFGFANQSALTRAFSQHLNISPARYRKQFSLVSENTPKTP